jgi:hypothetical protein
MPTHRGFMPQLKLRQPSRSLQPRALDLVTRVDFGGRNHRRVLGLTPPNNEASSGDLQIRFVGLTPIPRQADGNAPRAYVAQLVVNRI